MALYDLFVKDIEGTAVPLAQFKGKVLLVVNTATACGLTPQYEGLETLYRAFHERGFEILDFPSNQFNRQAPGSSQDIHLYCTGRFGISFPQFAKIKVNGKDTDPLFALLKSEQKGLVSKRIKWNFTKFLINRQGRIVKRFGPMTRPEKLRKAIEKLL
ncbi:MAG: glutathione peroxidase [Acholeplasmatales bacterium]|nr:MAG: glutathione peroxidase [Acholeplasmatales bacterium]